MKVDILQGDCIEVLKTLPGESVYCVVTSPPYDDLRTYGCKTCPEWDFQNTACELWRLMVPGAVICWVVANQVKDWGETLTAERQRLGFQEIGFSVRKMIYFKLNFSAPNHTFYHRLHEDITLCCKGTKPRAFNPIMDVPTVWKKALGRNTKRDMRGIMKPQKQGEYGDFAKRGDVWIGPTASQENPCKPIAHPATMPHWLASDLVLSWSLPGDVVLDPFGGSGTTAQVALELGRRAVLIELNPEYVKLAQQRCAVTPGLPLA